MPAWCQKGWYLFGWPPSGQVMLIAGCLRNPEPITYRASHLTQTPDHFAQGPVSNTQ